MSLKNPGNFVVKMAHSFRGKVPEGGRKCQPCVIGKQNKYFFNYKR